MTATTFTFGNFNGPLSATGGSAYKNTSTKAFVTTPVPHTLSTGQKVVIAGAIETGFNTAPTAVAITVLDASNFTYTLAAAQSGVATGPVTYTPPVATATALGHGFINGASITIAGATPGTYNGTFTIKNVTTNTFDYNFSGADPKLADASPADPVTPTPITATGTSNLRDTLVRWIRGYDTLDENGFKVNGADTDVRSSIHGDVLHSRPVVLNFAQTGTADNVYVFYGGNDGVFRAVKGGQRPPTARNSGASFRRSSSRNSGGCTTTTPRSNTRARRSRIRRPEPVTTSGMVLSAAIWSAIRPAL